MWARSVGCPDLARSVSELPVERELDRFMLRLDNDSGRICTDTHGVSICQRSEKCPAVAVLNLEELWSILSLSESVCIGRCLWACCHLLQLSEQAQFGFG